MICKTWILASALSCPLAWAQEEGEPELWDPIPAVVGKPGITGSDSSSAAALRADSWVPWWKQNRDALLAGESEEARVAAAREGAEAYLGVVPEVGEDRVAFDREGRAQEILTLLLRSLRSSSSSERERTAALRALATLGVAPAATVGELSRFALGPRSSEAQAACLALGRFGRAEALPILFSILSADKGAKEKRGGRPLPSELRERAAYAIGAIAWRLSAEKGGGPAEMIATRLVETLRDPASPQELAAACWDALSILSLSEARRTTLASSELLPRWKGAFVCSPGVRARLGLVLARWSRSLPSASALRSSWTTALLARLRDRKESRLVREAALLALAEIGAASGARKEEVRTLLLEVLDDRRSLLEPAFALFALGESSVHDGDRSVRRLVAELDTPLLEPWMALGWGRGVRRGAIAPDALKYTVDRVPRLESPALRGAFALSSALAGAPGSEEMLLEELESATDNVYEAHLVEALGILGSTAALPLLRRKLRDASADEDLQAALVFAIGRAGEVDAFARYLDLLGTSKLPSILAASARALGALGDARAWIPLKASIADAETTPLARAAALAAVGCLLERDAWTWSALYEEGMHPLLRPEVLRSARWLGLEDR